MNALKNWYKRTIEWARTEKALAMIAFAESSFFPIPPDPILLNMTLEKPTLWRRFAGISLVASVLGGVFGYLIGIALLESVGDWLINTYHLQESFDRLGELFQKNGLITILAAALTPIPYKVFTITAGAFSLNFGVFLIASIIGRGARFFAVAFAAQHFGKRYADQIGKYIDRISLAIIGLVIVMLVIVSLVL